MSENIVSFIANKLKQFREERDLTLAELHKRVDISAPTLSRYEEGTRPIPLEKLAKLCRYYDVSIKDFFSSFDPDESRDNQTESCASLQVVRENITLSVRSHKPLANRINTIVSLISEFTNLEIVTVFEYEWQDDCMYRLPLEQGQYLSGNIKELTEKQEAKLEEKYVDTDTAQFDTVYQRGKFLTGKAWDAWSLDGEEKENTLFSSSYQKFVVDRDVNTINLYSYERHANLLATTMVTSTMYGVIEACYPRFLLRVFNRSDIRSAPISKNQFSIFTNLCELASNELTEYISTQSLHQLRQLGVDYLVVDDLGDKLDKLNKIIEEAGFPTFLFFVRDSDTILRPILLKSYAIEPSFLNDLAKGSYAKKNVFELNDTPIIESQNHGMFLIFPMNQTVIKEDGKNMISETENIGALAIELSKVTQSEKMNYLRFYENSPELFNNIRQFQTIATAIVAENKK